MRSITDSSLAAQSLPERVDRLSSGSHRAFRVRAYGAYRVRNALIGVSLIPVVALGLVIGPSFAYSTHSVMPIYQSAVAIATPLVVCGGTIAPC